MNAAESTTRRWLIFADDCGLGRGLADRLERAGSEVTLVSTGERFERLSPRHYVIRPHVPGDYDALLADGPSDAAPGTILHLWNVTSRADLPDATYELTAFFSPLYLIQALGRRVESGAVSIILAANHLHRVTGGEPLAPAKSFVRGLCQVVPQEFPRIRCRSVDVQLPPDGSPERARLIAQIIAEGQSESGRESVAYRDAARFIEAVEPISIPSDERAPILRERGVYLITGGLGGIGRTLAAYLAESCRARLVLTYRHTRAQGATDIDDLASSLAKVGAETLIVQASADDMQAMAAIRDAIDRRFGPVNGVVHAAGISPGGLIQGQTVEKARAVLQPKVGGVRVLEALFPAAQLDFLLLCSSLASLTHVVGQADYTAANAYLDAYAQRAATPNIIAVNWDTWLHAGMASRALKAAAPGAEPAAQDGISPREGVEVFRRTIGAGVPQLAVSTKDLASQIEMSRGFDHAALLAIAGELDAAAPRRPRGTRADVKAPTVEIERRVARIWADALGIDPIGVADDFFELGGNSLVGIQILARLREAFPVELPLSAIFETPTVGGMAASLAAALAKVLEQRAGSAG